MQGFLAGKSTYVAVFERWFGNQGVVPLTQDLRELVLENMQRVIDFKEAIPADEL
jgi:polar amino acid transport system substrate-binding protein